MLATFKVIALVFKTLNYRYKFFVKGRVVDLYPFKLLRKER
jgi:hypothetical protein